MPEPDPHTERLLAELRRANAMAAAAWKRYVAAIGARNLTPDQMGNLLNPDNDIRGRRPVNRTPPA